MSRNKLTDKQEMYCRKYIELMNQRQAYICAYSADGMKPNTIDRKASELHGLPHIKERIGVLMAEREGRLEIDADYVLARLVEIDQMDVLDILNDDMSFKLISSWPKVWRQYLSGVDMAEMFDGRGDEREMVGILKKIKWPDKVKNLELIGKHVRIGAFNPSISAVDFGISDGDGIEEMASKVMSSDVPPVVAESMLKNIKLRHEISEKGDILKRLEALEGKGVGGIEKAD